MTKSTPPGITISAKIPWKILIVILSALLGGGGTWWAMDFYTRAEVDQRIRQSQEALKEHGHQSAKKLEQKVQANTSQIGKVKNTVDKIQAVQIKDISRAEARRVTSGIRSRAAREQAYDRLVDRNVKRLKRGADPCASVSCD